MKKLFMVTLAAVLIISAAGCAKKTAQQENPASPVQEETIVPETPAEPEDPVRRRTSGRQRRASLEEYRETYLTVPKIRNRKTVFVSEDVRDELDAVVRRLGGRGMSVSGLLENLAREHLAAYREDIEQWRKI